MYHIRDCLPSLKTRINQMVSHFQTLVNSFGEPIEDTVGFHDRFSLTVRTSLAGSTSASNHHEIRFKLLCDNRRHGEEYRSFRIVRLEGNLFFFRMHVCFRRCGGARICYIFHETFARALESINPLDNLATFDILTAIRNATVGIDFPFLVF